MGRLFDGFVENLPFLAGVGDQFPNEKPEHRVGEVPEDGKRHLAHGVCRDANQFDVRSECAVFVVDVIGEGVHGGKGKRVECRRRLTFVIESGNIDGCVGTFC